MRMICWIKCQFLGDIMINKQYIERARSIHAGIDGMSRTTVGSGFYAENRAEPCDNMCGERK